MNDLFGSDEFEPSTAAAASISRAAMAPGRFTTVATSRRSWISPRSSRSSRRSGAGVISTRTRPPPAG